VAEIVETHARKAGPLGDGSPQAGEIRTRRFTLGAGGLAGNHEGAKPEQVDQQLLCGQESA
jgi:hypothetical protein